MKTNNTIILTSLDGSETFRREFLRKGIIWSALASVAGLSLITGCKKESEEGISPAEDLMREHGVLNRIMLIYDSHEYKVDSDICVFNSIWTF
jgi:hypothetical protein